MAVWALPLASVLLQLFESSVCEQIWGNCKWISPNLKKTWSQPPAAQLGSLTRSGRAWQTLGTDLWRGDPGWILILTLLSLGKGEYWGLGMLCKDPSQCFISTVCSFHRLLGYPQAADFNQRQGKSGDGALCFLSWCQWWFQDNNSIIRWLLSLPGSSCRGAALFLPAQRWNSRCCRGLWGGMRCRNEPEGNATLRSSQLSASAQLSVGCWILPKGCARLWGASLSVGSFQDF